MVRIANFEEYKQTFLANNPKAHANMVLLRRERDNMLTWARKDQVEFYPGYAEEPFDEQTGSNEKGKKGTSLEFSKSKAKAKEEDDYQKEGQSVGVDNGPIL